MASGRSDSSVSRVHRPGLCLAVAACLAAGLVIPALAVPANNTQETRKEKAKAKAKERAEAKANAKGKARPAASQPAATQPATRPVDPAVAAKRAMLVKLATDYLTNWYARQLESTDWMARAVALISISRMPTADASATIIKRMEFERHPVCRLVAWQSALSRAGLLSDAEHAAWLASTRNMMRAGLFHGDLRIGLLEMLGSVPADVGTRACFRSLFAETSSLDSSDVPTLIAMGRCLRSWGDAGKRGQDPFPVSSECLPSEAGKGA